MAQIQDNKATELVYGSLFGYDFEDKILPKIEDLEKIISIYTFREYIYTHAVRCGFTGNVSDTEGLQQFVSKKCNEAGIELGSGTEDTIGRWLKGLPAKTMDGRDKVYKLCFALQMNAAQTMEFFLKAYLERPFNYKQISEAVYFYCLNNGYTYPDAIRIISVIEAHDVVSNPYADNVTEQIGAQLAEIESEEKLIKYLVENRSGFLKQNQTAINKINELKQSCFDIAPREYAISCNTNAEEMIIKNKVDSLLNVIYGYSADKSSDQKKIFKKSLKDSKIPKFITNNWPDKENFSRIKHGNASYDVIRRALIMLVFYDFFANAVVAEKEAAETRKKTGQEATAPCIAEGLFDEFVTETNTILAECGYVQLYWRNPFDWLIGYCAQSGAPLDTLREFIEEYYLSDETVCDQPQKLTETEIINRLSHYW